MDALEAIKKRIMDAALRSTTTPRIRAAMQIWPAAQNRLNFTWHKAFNAAYANGDVQSAEGYLATYEEELSAIMDKYDDLASDPLP